MKGVIFKNLFIQSNNYGGGNMGRSPNKPRYPPEDQIIVGCK